MNQPLLTENDVRETLRQVVDPEIGCNIVDLGLIYGIIIDGSTIMVQMTLTTPGCPMHESIAAGVERVLRSLPGVEDVDVQIVWDPPWHPSMMSEEGRAQVGLA